MDWKVQSTGSVVFPAQGTETADAFPMWQRLSPGAALTNYQSNAPMSVASGLHKGMTLSVNIQPVRWEINLNPPTPDNSRSSNEPPVFDDPLAALTETTALAKLLVGNQNPMRVSLIANCVAFFDTADEAVLFFKDTTGIQQIPVGSTDQSFSLNVRRKFGSAGWDLNRVCRWSVGQVMLVMIDVGQATGGAQPHVQVAKHQVSLVIDANTSPRPIPIGQAQALQALDELQSDIIAIFRGGYDALVAS